MSIGLMKSKIILFLIFFVLILFSFSHDAFSKEESIRSLLNSALKFYIKLDYSKAVDELEKASLMLRNLAPLRVEKLLFCNKIEMFAKYEPRKSNVFYPGESFIIYFQPGNYSLLQKDDGWEIHLREYYEIVDESGKVISKMDIPLEFHTTLFSPLFTGLYFRNAGFVPEKDGKYTIRVILDDLIKGKTLEASLTFEVKD